MATTIKTKNSTTAATAPTGLVQGELAVNITDKKLYVGDSVGNSIQIAGAGATNAAGGSNTQVQYNSSGALAGSSSFVFDGTNVGIGTSSPSTYGKFTVVGGQANIVQNSSPYQLGLSYNTSTQGFLLGSPAASTLAFYNWAGTEFARIDSSGNLGLGVTPSAWNVGKTIELGSAVGNAVNGQGTNDLEIVSNAYYNSGFKFAGTGYANRLDIGSAAGAYKFFVSNASGTAGNAITWTQAMTLDASGNLGIGTSSPTQKLDIASGGKIYLRRSDNGTGGTIHNGGAGSGGLIFNELNSEGFAWQLGSTEKMRIDSSGNLRIGQTAVPNAGDGNTTTGASIEGGGVGTIYGSRADSYSGSFNRNSDGLVVKFNRSGTGVGSVSVTTTATAYNTSSDYRLKENIAPMTGALATVAQLKPVTYTWKADGSDGQGFIAHELQAVVPDCVTGEKDAVDADGNPVYQGIDTSFLVATLTAAIQELKAEFDAYKATHP